MTRERHEFFHGTCAVYLDSIMERGLVGPAFVTQDGWVADGYAERAVAVSLLDASADVETCEWPDAVVLELRLPPLYEHPFGGFELRDGCRPSSIVNVCRFDVRPRQPNIEAVRREAYPTLVRRRHEATRARAVSRLEELNGRVSLEVIERLIERFEVPFTPFVSPHPVTREGPP